MLILSAWNPISLEAGGFKVSNLQKGFVARNDISIIEAYSRRNKIEKVEGPNACGMIIGNKAIDIILHVTTSYGVTDVYIDRWD